LIKKNVLSLTFIIIALIEKTMPKGSRSHKSR